MKTVSPNAPSPRIVMFGLSCAFTDAVADQLSACGLAPTTLIIFGHPGIDQPQRIHVPTKTLPMASQPAQRSATLWATYRIGRLTATPTIELIESLEPDIIIVACFPRLIPKVVRDIPRQLACNIHPSLLPAHRGPDPLFWIMRSGGDGCGVTVHELSGKLDAGDILAQRALPYPAGVREGALERRLAVAGADLAVEVIDEFRHGRRRAETQSESAASYESWPDAEDFSISVDRPVLHAWNFIRGVASRGVPIRVDTGLATLLVVDALDYGTGSCPPKPESEQQVAISFSDGWLLALTQPTASH